MGWPLCLALLVVGPSALFEFSLVDLTIGRSWGNRVYAFAGVWARLVLSGQPALVNALGMLMGSSILMMPIVIVPMGFQIGYPAAWAAV